MGSLYLWKRNWVHTARRVYAEVLLDDCLGASAQLAYYFLLVGFLPIDDVVGRMMHLLARVMPDQAMDQVERTVAALVESNGTLLPVSVIGALIVASNGMRAIMVTMNRAYSVREGRSWWHRYILAVSLTLALALTVIVASVLLSLAGRIGAWIAGHWGTAWGTTWWLGARVAGFAALLLILELIYYLAPNVRRPWHWITPGSILGVLLWFAGSRMFTMYVARFGQYEILYAGLGAVVVFLLWLYIVGFAILIGAELNAELERSRGVVAPVDVPAPSTVDEAGHDRSVRDAVGVGSAGTSDPAPPHGRAGDSPAAPG
jgi:membrane protein